MRNDRLSTEARERMTAQERENASRWAGIENGTVTVEGTHPAIARMNEVMAAGTYERDAATGFLMQKALIAGERFYYNLVTHQGDAVLAFFSADRFGHTRRVLVTRAGIYWLHLEGQQVIGTHNKYALKAAELLAKRASGGWRAAA